MKRSIILLLLLPVLCACKNTPEKFNLTDVKLMPPANASADMRIDEPVGNADSKRVDQVKFPPPLPGKEVAKKIIKQGDISFETGDTKHTREAIYAELKRLDGYISSESENTNTDLGRKEYTLTTQIPAKNFDSFLNNVSAGADKIDSKNISMRDVTTEYIDITTRLANKKKLEERYLELLRKGDKMSDILEIENKLNEIRTDIESTQGQLNYLNKQIDYSSLQITFYTKQTVNDGAETFGYKFTHSLSQGWSSLGDFFFSVIAAWPFLLVVAVIIGVFRRWRKSRRAKKATNS